MNKRSSTNLKKTLAQQRRNQNLDASEFFVQRPIPLIHDGLTSESGVSSCFVNTRPYSWYSDGMA